jgi:tetratricopeptide (TPR) repeat protein
MKKHFVLTILVMVAASLLSSGCAQDDSAVNDEEKNVYYERGMKYFELKDYRSARLELKNALAIDPQFAKAGYQLALADLKLKEPRSGAHDLARVAKENPRNRDSRLKLAELLFIAKRTDESRALVNKILEGNKGYADALALFAKIQLRENLPSDAEKTIDRAIAQEPGLARLYLIRANIFSALKDVPGEEKALRKNLALEPDNPQAHKNLVNFYLRHGKTGQAVAYLEDILNTHPESPELHIKLASIYEKNRKFHMAENRFVMVTELDPDNYVSYLLLGHFYGRHNRGDDAETAYKKAFSKAHGAAVMEVKAVFAHFYFNREKYDLAEEKVDEILVEHPGYPKGNLLKARLLIVKGKYRKALALLDNLLREQPDWVEAAYFKAVAHFQLYEIRKAERTARHAMEKSKQDERPQALMGQILLVKGDPETAEKVAAEALRKNPGNFNAALVLGKTLVAQNILDKAMGHLEQMHSYYPDDLEVMHHLGITCLALKKTEEAEHLFEKILLLQPDHVPALSYIVGNHLDRNDRKAAVKRIRRQMDKAPGCGEYPLFLGQLLYEDGAYDQALGMFRRAQKLSPESSATNFMVARALGKLGKNSEEIKANKKRIEKNPGMVSLYIKLGALLEENGDTKGAGKIYEKALEYNPEYWPAANNLACLRLKSDAPDLDEALFLSLHAKSLAPENPQVSNTLGWVHHKRGSYQLASSHLRQSVLALPNNPVVRYHYALNLKGLGKSEQALAELKKCRTMAGDFPERKRVEKLISEWG